MTASSNNCYSPEALALFLAVGFPARDLPRLDEHLLECELCRKTIEQLWRDDQMQSRLQDRKAVQTTARLLRGEASSTESEESRDEQFLRQTRRLVNRFLDDNVEPAPLPASTADLQAQQSAALTSPAPEGSSPHAGPLVAPPRIPGLELGQPIGQGGMGIVYQALDVTDGRVLACKVLSTACPSSDELDRFDVEARATMRLDHPHIIHVESAGAVDGRPYLVMEFASGGTLHKMLGGQPQPPIAAADLIAKLADALEHAHRRGVLHRDLKPTNILLVPRQPPAALPPRENTLADYDPKIADFGIAKLLDSRTLRTQTGQLLGTPAFAAPEQFIAEFGAVGPAADIYSLGAILYLMLTGLPPLPEDNPRRMLALVRHFEPVAPRRFQPEVPVDLETICLCCLEKRTRWRYRSAGELALDLRRFLAGKPILARPRNRWRRAARWVSRNRVASVALVGLAMLSALSLAYARSQWRIGQLRLAGEAQSLELSKAKNARFNSDAEATQLRTFSALDASNDVKALDYCLQVALSKFAPLAPPANEELSVRSLSKLRAYSILDTLPTISQRLILPVETMDASASSERRSPRRQLSFNPTSGRLAVTDAHGGRVWEVDISSGKVTEQSCASGPFTIDMEWRLSPSGDSAGPILRRTNDSVPPVSLERPAESPEDWRRLWISPGKDIALALGSRAGQLMCYGWRLPSGRGLMGSVGPLDESTQGIVFINEGAMLVGDERCQSVSFRGGKLTDAGYISGGRIPIYVNHWRWTYDFRGRYDQQLHHPQISMAFREAVNELRAFTKVTVAAVDPSESKLAFGYSNGRIGVIDDIDCGMRFAKCEQLSQPIERIAFSPDSRRLLACSEAGELLVLDLDEGRLAIPVLPNHHRLLDAAWSPDSRDIAVLDERGLLTVWRVDTLGFQSATRSATNASATDSSATIPSDA
ncbi:MAG: WD40 repeat domain-containing serine/threonine protein kinase, partial [Planctomycetota bacterium]